SGNGGDGIYIQGGSGNTVLTNEIGNGGGNTAVPNHGSGIYLDSTVNPTVHTSLIGGNTSHGIRIAGGSGALVVGNVIGVTLDGNNPLPNGGNGISLEGTTGATIGQAGGGLGNTMSSNGGAGIALTNSSNTTIDAAVVGLNVFATTALPNLGDGVLVQGASNNNSIGTPATASYVATNAGIGVAILGGTGNRIRGTRIFANGAQGIDLDRNGAAPFDGVTFNDPGDVDSGANGLLNAPVLLSATVTAVNGRLRGLPNMQHTIELFNSASCDKVGFGEGTTLLALATVTTNGSGTATFSIGPWSAVASNSSYSATATDAAGNTSEFSQCVTPGRRPVETLALFSPSTDTAGLTGSLYGISSDRMPLAALTVYAPGVNLNAQGQQGNWVMGDWDGDGIQTPGVYASGGAFFYTNSSVATASWTGIWFGYPNRQAVAGRFDGAVNHDCIGIIDSAPWGAQDTAFVMYWTCDLTSGPGPPKNGLWLGVPLATSGFGDIGAHQFVAGDFDGDGVDTIAVRRGPYFVWGGLAQNFGMPLAEYGNAVAGDWDGDGISTFGIYYQTEQFFYLNHLDWANQNYTQQFLPSNHGMTEPLRPVSWRPGGS
ncbi:MAG TPA: right-handed parallel beta-helix repeat-containing protein, partial [Thermoanaerobaculia bacterium]|nr:right-handed parallel beta-helix repeat-containing protein [Thermoanaerobaculia bacterium]